MEAFKLANLIALGCIFAIAGCAAQNGPASSPTQVSEQALSKAIEAVRSLRDEDHGNTNDQLVYVKLMRFPMKERPKVWIQMVDDRSLSQVARAVAFHAFFARHVRPPIRATELNAKFGIGHWFTRESVPRFGGGSGWSHFDGFNFDWDQQPTLYPPGGGEHSSFWAISLAISRKLVPYDEDPNEFLNAVQGKNSSDIKIVGLVYAGQEGDTVLLNRKAYRAKFNDGELHWIEVPVP